MKKAFSLYSTIGKYICSNKIGSPTALGDEDLLKRLIQSSRENKRKIFVPCGAFWGASDITKMANKGSLKGLKVTMKKHPSSLKLEGSLREILEKSVPLEKELILYDGKIFHVFDLILLFLHSVVSGPVRGICSLAPNNCNTMAIGQ